MGRLTGKPEIENATARSEPSISGLPTIDRTQNQVL